VADQLCHPLDVVGCQVNELEGAVGDCIEEGGFQIRATVLVEPIARLSEDSCRQQKRLPCHVQIAK